MKHFHEVAFVPEIWDIRGPLCEWLRRDPAIHTANVQRRGEGVRLEWVRDRSFRFFPIVQDKLFGDMPNVIDIGTNIALAWGRDAKLHATASRRYNS